MKIFGQLHLINYNTLVYSSQTDEKEESTENLRKFCFVYSCLFTIINYRHMESPDISPYNRPQSFFLDLVNQVKITEYR